MKFTITQLRKANANPKLPEFIHTGYRAEDYAGMMFTANPGYEIAAVYVMADAETAATS